MVFFRDQTLNDEAHAAFAQRFGPLYTHPSTKRHDNIAQLQAEIVTKSAEIDRLEHLLAREQH